MKRPKRRRSSVAAQIAHHEGVIKHLRLNGAAICTGRFVVDDRTCVWDAEEWAKMVRRGHANDEAA